MISLENYLNFTQEEVDNLLYQVKQASIVLGIDRNNVKNMKVFYGRETLALIIMTGITDELEVLQFGISFSEKLQEVEFLCALCKVAKGKDEYQTKGDVEKSLQVEN